MGFFFFFFVIVVLYYYYAKLTWNHNKDDIYFRSRRDVITNDEITLRLRKFDENEVEETNLTPNELYHVKRLRQMHGNNVIYQ